MKFEIREKIDLSNPFGLDELIATQSDYGVVGSVGSFDYDDIDKAFSFHTFQGTTGANYIRIFNAEKFSCRSGQKIKLSFEIESPVYDSLQKAPITLDFIDENFAFIETKTMKMGGAARRYKICNFNIVVPQNVNISFFKIIIGTVTSPNNVETSYKIRNINFDVEDVESVFEISKNKGRSLMSNSVFYEVGHEFVLSDDITNYKKLILTISFDLLEYLATSTIMVEFLGNSYVISTNSGGGEFMKVSLSGNILKIEENSGGTTTNNIVRNLTAYKF